MLFRSWSPESYAGTVLNSHSKFPPELILHMIPWLSMEGYMYWQYGVKQSTLAACCLVSREWNGIFTSVLYSHIYLGKTKSLLTRSLLHRTLHHTQPSHKILVKKMTIECTDDGSTANLLAICFSLPNLCKLVLAFTKPELSTLHPNFAQQLRSLSRHYTADMVEIHDGNVETYWYSLNSFINFIRYSRATLHRFWVDCQGGE